MGKKENKIKKVKCFIKSDKKSKDIANKVIDILESNGFEVVDKEYDLGIAIGGDGTFLYMIKDSSFNGNPLFVGINAGTLGFAQEISINEIEEFIQGLKNSNYIYERVHVGEIEIQTEDSTSKLCCLNEIVVRDEKLDTLNLDVLVDNHLLEKYVGDGILVATSFGSTAYNLSFGGSIVYNTFPTLQITPIAPINNESYHNLMNSIIIPSKKRISLVPKKHGSLLLTIDGDNHIYKNVQSINVILRNKSIKVIRKKDYHFIQKVNDKFLK